MYSKLSVLSKICKFPNFNRNRFKRLLKYENGSIRNIFTQPRRITLWTPQQNHFNSATGKNIIKSFQVACSMSSSNKEGNGENTKNVVNKKKLFKMRKRRSLQTFQPKDLKKSTGDYKSSEGNVDYNQRSLKSKAKAHPDLKLKAKNEPTTNQDIAQSYVPQTKVHVEFMESQNLRDFHLNNSHPSRNIFSNVQKNSIDASAKRLNSYKDQNFSNKKVEEKSLIVLKTQNLKNTDSATPIKQTLKNKKNSLIKDLSEKFKFIASTPSKTRKPTQVAKSDSQNKLPFKMQNHHKVSKVQQKSTENRKGINTPIYKDQKKASSKHKNNSMATENSSRKGSLKINKSDKSTSFSGAGSAGSDGSGGSKQSFKGGTRSTKESPKKFWRYFSLTVLPLVLAFTGYVLSNLGAAEVLKIIKKRQLPLNMSQTSYENRLKTEQLYTNEISSKGITDAENDDELITINESEKEDFFKLPF